jgi:hypothetical protein
MEYVQPTSHQPARFSALRETRSDVPTALPHFVKNAYCATFRRIAAN